MENKQEKIAEGTTPSQEVLLPGEKAKVRYAFLDELRGFMVLCMVFHHGLLTVYQVLGYKTADTLFEFFGHLSPFFAGGFILLSGMMCGFSHSNIIRGAKCFGVAILVTIVTVMAPDSFGRIEIRFGILHLLGISMLFCGIFNFALKKVNKWVGFLTSFVLFLLLYGVPTHQTDFLGIRSLIPAAWNFNRNLYPFGITAPDFFSADYYPLIPWLFLFVAGFFLYKFHFVEKHSNFFAPSRIKPLGFLGRHALIIYIVHQPIIYLLCIPFI